MDVMYPRCCGLDVHKKTVAACLMTSTEGPEPVKEIRTFRTVSLRRPCLTSDQHEQSGHSWHSGVLPICMGATPH